MNFNFFLVGIVALKINWRFRVNSNSFVTRIDSAAIFWIFWISQSNLHISIINTQTPLEHCVIFPPWDSWLFHVWPKETIYVKYLRKNFPSLFRPNGKTYKLHFPASIKFAWGLGWFLWQNNSPCIVISNWWRWGQGFKCKLKIWHASWENE